MLNQRELWQTSRDASESCDSGSEKLDQELHLSDDGLEEGEIWERHRPALTTKDSNANARPIIPLPRRPVKPARASPLARLQTLLTEANTQRTLLKPLPPVVHPKLSRLPPSLSPKPVKRNLDQIADVRLHLVYERRRNELEAELKTILEKKLWMIKFCQDSGERSSKMDGLEVERIVLEQQLMEVNRSDERLKRRRIERRHSQ